MLKVLHLLSSDRFSGAENVVCQIITAFDGDSEVEHLYVSPEGPIRETLKEKNIRYVPVKYLNGIDLKRIVRIEQPDIIHAHDMLASLFATFCVRNIPIVSHIHNNNFGFKGVGPFVTSLAYCIAARRAKHIFWVSEAAYNGFRYKKICSSKSSVLYNVINIEELNNSIKIDPEKYINNYRFLLKKEDENNDKLNSMMQDFSINKTASLINKKMESDKAITKYNNEIIKATNIYTKYTKGTNIGAILIIKNNREIYFMDEVYNKELSKFYSSHLIKWEIIKKYLDEGYKIFNFGSIKNMDKNNGNYLFKMGFGGEVYETIGSYDLVINKWLYGIVKLISKIKK